MTRTDFQLIAEVVRDAEMPPLARLDLARQFADKLERASASFDRVAFQKACNPWTAGGME